MKVVVSKDDLKLLCDLIDKYNNVMTNYLKIIKRYKEKYDSSTYARNKRNSDKKRNSTPGLQITNVYEVANEFFTKFLDFFKNNPNCISDLKSFSKDSLTFEKQIDSLPLLFACLFYGMDQIKDGDKHKLESLCCHLLISGMIKNGAGHDINLDDLEILKDNFDNVYKSLEAAYYNPNVGSIYLNSTMYSKSEISTLTKITQGNFWVALSNFDKSDILISFFGSYSTFLSINLFAEHYMSKHVIDEDWSISDDDIKSIKCLIIAYLKLYFILNAHLFEIITNSTTFKNDDTALTMRNDLHHILDYATNVVEKYFNEHITIFRDDSDNTRKVADSSQKIGVISDELVQAISLIFSDRNPENIVNLIEHANTMKGTNTNVSSSLKNIDSILNGYLSAPNDKKELMAQNLQAEIENLGKLCSWSITPSVSGGTVRDLNIET